MHDRRLHHCLTAARNATTGKLFPEPDPAALVAAVRAALGKSDALDDNVRDLDAEIEGLWADNGIEIPELVERGVRQVWAGDFVWSDVDQWFYELRMALLDPNKGCITFTYADGTVAEFDATDHVTVARHQVEARVWNTEAKRRAAASDWAHIVEHLAGAMS